MGWNLERIQSEVQAFQEFAIEVIGDIKGVNDLVECPVEISKRMTRTKGLFEYEFKRRNGVIIGVKPLKIKIAQHLLDNYHDADIIDVIRHECVHHIVDIKTKGKSRGHDEIFKKYCRKLGVSDETYFTAKPKTDITEKPKTLDKRFVGMCVECGNEFNRKTMKRDTIHTWLYYSTCTCGGKLHVKDLKNKIVYVQNQYKNLDFTISLDDYDKKYYKFKTKENYIEDAEKLGTYKHIGACQLCDFRSEIDYLWWELYMVLDASDDLDLSTKDKSDTIRWLIGAREFTDEFKDDRTWNIS